MAKLIIVEGARTAGKTTLVHSLRQQLHSSTSINMTGYKDDDAEGIQKIDTYYNAFLDFLKQLDNSYTVILDRMFLSEMVYSKLYKSYDFTPRFHDLLERLFNQGHDIRLFLLQVTREACEHRLKREKTDYFGTIGDTVEEIFKQQTEYLIQVHKMLSRSYGRASTLEFYPIETSYRNPEDILRKVKALSEKEPGQVSYN